MTLKALRLNLFFTTENVNIEPLSNSLTWCNRLSTSDVDKTLETVLEKMAELNCLLKSLMPPEQKKVIGKYVGIMVTKATNTAFNLMAKTVSPDKELG